MSTQIIGFGNQIFLSHGEFSWERKTIYKILILYWINKYYFSGRKG